MKPYIGHETFCLTYGDGLSDVFVSGALQLPDGTGNALWMSDSTRGNYALAAGHPLAQVTDVNTALWGDIDNDGLVDVYICRRGPNQLWRQGAKGEWQLVSELGADERVVARGGAFLAVGDAVRVADGAQAGRP